MNRWADTVNATSSDGIKREFKHPFLQACCMFIGEFLCLLVFKAVYYSLRRRRVSYVFGNILFNLKNVLKFFGLNFENSEKLSKIFNFLEHFV